MESKPMIFPAWATLLLAVPVVCLGAGLVRIVPGLARFAIPSPVVGGLLVAGLVLALRDSAASFGFDLATSARAWTWFVTPEPVWAESPTRHANLLFMAVFFASVGLSASWQRVRQAGRLVLVFLMIATGFAILQNALGLLLAEALGVSPLLGLACGSLSLTGGHATALGFASELERAGLTGAQAIGTAAATFGLVAGALLAGPVGSALIRKRGLRPSEPGKGEEVSVAKVGLVEDLRAIAGEPHRVVIHMLLLVVCLKAGAWVSHWLQLTGLSFPVVIGTMLAGVIARNVHDFAGMRWFSPGLTDAIGSVALAVFLATAMMSLNLHELVYAAAPMLCILGVQIGAIIFFARWVTYPLMGRDYDAAVMAGGHCGFGLGSTTTAIAGMKALVGTTGPAPRAFLVVPLVGGFLVDITNSLNLAVFINLVHTNPPALQ